MFIALNETLPELITRRADFAKFVIENSGVDTVRFAKRIMDAREAQDYNEFNFLLHDVRYATAMHVTEAKTAVISMDKLITASAKLGMKITDI